MLTQIFSRIGAGKLRPIFSKMAFMFLLLFVAFASQEVNGQVIVVLEELDAASNSSSSTNIQLEKIEVKPSETLMDLNVFPNPFSHKLTIQASASEGLEYVELLDENGAYVWGQNIYSFPNKFLIESLEPGTYVLNLTTSSGVVSESLTYSP
ncbi:MAG: T9SS type A sorting domain-containing protein [Bacteroidota bacterium]